MLKPNDYYHGPDMHIMHGLGLGKDILDKIYESNFLRFIER